MYYCSKDCQAANWPIHKSCCKYQEQTKTDATEVNTDVLCGYCKTKSYDLKTCSGCRNVSYCSKACQSRAWPDHKLTCAEIKRKKYKVNIDDMFRTCAYCNGMIVDVLRRCHCYGCSNIYCTKYCLANDWPRHKLLCKSRPGQTGHQFQDVDIRCNSCSKTVDLKLCSRCHGVNYCSKICQKADWKNHKSMCRESENPNEKDMKQKIEIEMKLKEIAVEQNKDFRHCMSPGNNLHATLYGSKGGCVSALLYDDFVDLTMYRTLASGSWDKALLCVRKTYPEHLILQQMNKVPNEHGYVSSKQMLLLFIPRYHHYRGRHCVYVEDVDKEELYIAFYFTTDQSRCFKWSEIRPGRFIVILNPIIHHFNDSSVGFRLENPDVFKFIDI